MKVSELPKNTNLTDIKVKLPKEVLEAYKDYYGGEEEMYIGGGMMGDFFMSPDAKTTGKRRLYPMPPSLNPSNVLDWEVVPE